MTVDWNTLPLGEIPDRAISRILAVQGTPRTRRSVASARKVRGIPSSVSPVPLIDWDSLPLGQISDQDIADLLAARGTPCGRPRVTVERNFRGIDRFRPGSMAARARALDWDALPLGRVQDDELAQQLGVSVNHVRDARLARRIQPSWNRDKWDVQPLGKILDICIAARMGVTHVAVLYQRRRRRIPPAPQNDKNLLLGLLYKNPGCPTRWYADRLGRPEPSVRRDLKIFEKEGFVQRDGLLWQAVHFPRTKVRKPRSCKTNPSPVQ